MIYIPPWQMQKKPIKAGNLSVGSVVKLMEGGSAVEYLVVNQGKPSGSSLYDDSCDGTWLLRKGVNTERAWDSGSGDDGYQTSTINAWMNGDFFNSLGSVERATIRQVQIPYYSMSLGNPISKATCKAFLLSGYEVGWTSAYDSGFPVDGAKLDYFTAGSSGDVKRMAYTDGGSIEYWGLRSSVAGSNGFAWYVTSSGTPEHNQGVSVEVFVRPAVILPKEALVEKHMLIGLPDGYVDPTTALTWVFDEFPTIPNSYYKEVNISFTAGGTTYGSITVEGHEDTGNYGRRIYFGGTAVYIAGAGWISNNSIRTISLPSPATGDALTLLRQFATPKS